MSLHESSLGDVTRGGQTTLHFFRMLGQVLKKFGAVLLFVYSIATFTQFWSNTDSYERYLGARYISTWIGYNILQNGENITPIDMPDGKTKRVKLKTIWGWNYLHSNWDGVLNKWIRAMIWSFLSVSLLVALLFWYIRRTGISQKAEDFLRGGQVVPAKELAQALRIKKKASDLVVAGMPLVFGSETSHILLAGSPGTGKSTLLRQLLGYIRHRGDRAICFSPSGDLIEWFYRDSDVILNPFDDRCPAWNLFDECEQDYHFDGFAAAMIPQPTKSDPFWNNSARVVLSSLIATMKGRGEYGVTGVLDRLTRWPLEDLYDYLRSTEAAALIDPASEKTAVSIRATAASFARALRYVGEEGDPFHIREWVLNDSGSDWVFLNARPDQIEAVRPLISAWIEIFTNTLMSLPADSKRRVWLIIDELPALNKIPSLSNFLAQARKYGGCGVIAFQQISQLRDRYGHDGAEDLAGLCATWVSMRQNDPETARWSANSFGETEILEAQENISYGAHEIRDGVSLSKTRKMRPLVLPSEILNLDDLEGYLRLPGDWPVGQYRMQYKKPKVIAPAFIPTSRKPASMAPIPTETRPDSDDQVVATAEPAQLNLDDDLV